MRTRDLVLAFAVIATSTPISSAVAEADHPLASQAPFSLWVGDWEGTGWSVSQSGERIAFELRESVRERAAGNVLLADGCGVRTDSAAAGAVTHDGVVLVYRDALGRLRWNGHDARAAPVDAELSLIEHGMRWDVTTERGAIVRFTILLDAATWREFAEVSADGATWSKFMEVTLTRTPP